MPPAPPIWKRRPFIPASIAGLWWRAVSERVAGPCGSGPPRRWAWPGVAEAAFGAAAIPARKKRLRRGCAISRLGPQTERRTRGPSEGRRIGRRERIAGGRITRFDRDDREVRGS